MAFVASSQESSGGDYRAPPPDALQDLPEAVLAGDDGREQGVTALLARHDYRLTAAREVHLVVPGEVPDARGWGLYAVRPDGLGLLVEVPHPRADRFTEHLGAALAQRAQAQQLLVAGARRDRADGAADVAHREDSLFAAVHAAAARRGLPAVQLHGYAQSSSPGTDVVVSPGSAELSALVERLADVADAAGFRTCRAWAEECGPLEGRTNVQGVASAAAGAAFAHVEVSAAVREDPDRRGALVDALSAAVREVLRTPAEG